MRRLIGIGALVFVGVLAWRVGGMLSPDAIGLATGLVFGLLAGLLPAALFILTASRRQRMEHPDDDHYPKNSQRLQYYPQQPPVIVVTGAQGAHAQPPALPAHANPYQAATPWTTPRPERAFRIVGERDDLVE